jgi:NAD+ kinase
MTKKPHFQTVGIIGRYGDSAVSATIIELSDHLKRLGAQVLLDEGTAELVRDHKLEVASRQTIGKRCDLVVVVGGDGTLLNAARSLTDYDVSILGINRGRLGFLTDISPSQMGERLQEIMHGQFAAEDRLLLHTYIERDGEHISESTAFNDVVVHKWDVARMIEFRTYINDKFVHLMRSDGLIVSTPTGSTAYALSGGGPILHPGIHAVVLVPICPHTMSNRPLVIDASSVIRIEVSDHTRSPAQITCDGQINLGLVSGDRVIIRKKDLPIRLIHPHDHNYFDVLRAKLRWSETPT